MDQTVVWVAVAILIVVAVGALWFVYEQRRRRGLKEHFGPEYERVVAEEGNERRADRVLSDREARVKKLDLQPLPDSTRETFVAGWRKVQEQFVDDPLGAVTAADALIGEAMVARGYPVGDFEQRASDISVEHADVVTDYRAGHDIAARRSEANTEELRRAMVHFRSLFSELVAPAARPTEEKVEEREETVR